ncbi:hypothetical protein COU37_04705 [Candidatus Micrarchaeota archaeon CG10_big_fil_rev_8_21_14_0_10_45_29]|nr:MAG: hypothetical protein COU37_04705 [Candidatus Micrarchaeota archaeon CG10_big_fil_rev_8_21_14_0_10_45_29]
MACITYSQTASKPSKKTAINSKNPLTDKQTAENIKFMSNLALASHAREKIGVLGNKTFNEIESRLMGSSRPISNLALMSNTELTSQARDEGLHLKIGETLFNEIGRRLL